MRDQQHRTPGHLRLHRNGYCGFGPVLLGRPVQDPLGDQQFLPLDADLMKLLGQLISENVQFTCRATGFSRTRTVPIGLPGGWLFVATT